MDRIINSFTALGLPIDEKAFGPMASSGKILLLLDAFDEVPDELKSKVLMDIEDLAGTYDKLRIIVTSRPNNNFHMSNHFSVVTLDNLRDKEYTSVIQKLAANRSSAENLIEHIEKNAPHVKELLCTPLMVTLLVLSYKSSPQLPANLSDFYNSLFKTLMSRHDGTKPGYTRPRSCAIDDNEYRDAFEYLCILSKKIDTQSFSFSNMQSMAKDALSGCSIKAKPSAFVDDIIKITCLIIKDGEEHRFIHKTVQEYYTASYIQKKPEKWAKDFYKRIVDRQQQFVWAQELSFLSEIDSYRYNRFYYLPELLLTLKIKEKDLESEWSPLSLSDISKVFENYAFQRNDENSSIRVLISGSPKSIIAHLTNQIIRSSPDIVKEIKVAFNKFQPTDESIKFFLAKEITQSRPEGQIIILSDAIINGFFQKLVDRMQIKFLEMFKLAQKINLDIKNDESASILDGLI